MNFYVLERHSEKILPSSTEYSTISEPNLGKAMKCLSCGRFISLLPWLPPYRVELTLRGNVYGDLAIGVGDEFLVSERFKCLYHEQGLTGLEEFGPVEIIKVKRMTKKAPKTPPPPYYMVRVVYSRTKFDIENSGMEGDGPIRCPECLDIGHIKRTPRLIIDPASWTGEDLFRARGLTGTINASERFKTFCDTFKITNAILIPGEEYGFDFYPNEKLL